MAVGFSGSNGGITKNYRPIRTQELQFDVVKANFNYPLEISYFLNNACNLKCRHCYVGYENTENTLTPSKWKEVFKECIDLGALTFGNVGKEPTLVWDETIEVLKFFSTQREINPLLRFGLVTNALKLRGTKAEELNDVMPSYLDVSLDGTKEVHDSIRGNGTYEITKKNISNLSNDLKKRLFISFTVNKWNLHTIPDLINEVYELGVRNFLISPYVPIFNKNKLYNEHLFANDTEIVNELRNLIDGSLVNFSMYNGLKVYVKIDYSTSFELMQELENKKFIDTDNLLIDDYGVIFSKFDFDSNMVYFNYLPWDDTFVRSIRFSHDGYVSNCYDMFFKKYVDRTSGNVNFDTVENIIAHRNPASIVVPQRN